MCHTSGCNVLNEHLETAQLCSVLPRNARRCAAGRVSHAATATTPCAGPLSHRPNQVVSRFSIAQDNRL